MDAELQRFISQLDKALRPEDIFGDIGTKDDPARELGHRFKRFSRICHPDKHPGPDNAAAVKAFARLSELNTLAEARLLEGVYGTAPAIVISAGKQVYELHRKLGDGDVSTVYAGTGIVAKVSLSPDCNAFLANEQKQLKVLQAALKSESSRDYFSFPKATLDVSGRRVTIFEASPGYMPLTEILSRYPRGLDARHFVWMFKRVLSALMYAHDAGLVHGAVLPPNLLVNPAIHGVKLIDFCFSVKAGERITAKSRAYKTWYPPEVDAKRQVGAALDLYMAAKTMIAVLGETVPHPIFRRVLDGCLIQNPAYRQQTAVGLYTSLDEFAKKVYGPPRFVELVVNNATTAAGV